MRLHFVMSEFQSETESKLRFFFCDPLKYKLGSKIKEKWDKIQGLTIWSWQRDVGNAIVERRGRTIGKRYQK